MLKADYQPVTGIRRVGRAPKVYQPVDADIRISIPPRHHDLLADILLAAVLAEDAPGCDDVGERATAGVRSNARSPWPWRC